MTPAPTPSSTCSAMCRRSPLSLSVGTCPMLREIAGRRIGPDAPVFVIAEIGLNHGGSIQRALDLVDAAAEAGASAVKLQTLYADRLVAAACPPPAHVQASSLREFFAG